MEEVGVLAVVQELQSFLGDMRKVNSALDSLRPSSSLLEQAFQSLGSVVGWFGQQILNIAEITIGVLLRDAIEGIINFIRNLIGEIIQAGAEFQTLSIRLQRLNFNTLVESGMEFNQAMKESIELTKQQLDWITRLAVQTPYDATDIANTFTLARAYGLTATESQRLTKNILDFASGMGLGNEEMQRIVINFGQLIQQNKLNAQDLKDLARGAFVPVNDVLARMASNMGISVEKLNEMRSSGKLGADAVKNFIEAFNQLVEERFVGASEKMSRTIEGATANFKDLFKSIIGLNVVKPILDVVGGKLADLITSIAGNEDVWQQLNLVAQSIGVALSNITGDIISSFLPNMDQAGNAVLTALEGISNWLTSNREGIVNFFVGIGNAILSIVPFITNTLIPGIAAFGQWIWDNREGIWNFFVGIGNAIMKGVVPFITNTLIPAFNTISQWVSDHQEEINKFFEAIGNIISKVFGNLFGGKAQPGKSPLDSFLDSLGTFMDFVTTNQDAIATFITFMIQLVIVSQVLALVWNILIGVIAGVFGVLMPLITIFGIAAIILSALGAPIYAVIAGLLLLGIAVGLLVTHWQDINTWAGNFIATNQAWSDSVNATVSAWATSTWATISAWGNNFVASNQAWSDSVNASISAWASGTWASISAWASGTWASISAWAAGTWAAISAWASSTWATIAAWASGVWSTILSALAGILASVSSWAQNILNTMKGKFTQVISAIKGMDWVGLGKSIVQGIIKGVESLASSLISTLTNLAIEAYQAAMAAISGGSPSKLFAEVGASMIEGMILGIQGYTRAAVGAMNEAVGRVVAPAMILPTTVQLMAMGAGGVTNNQSTNNNWNLAIHTSARTEPIVQDFNMMKSLAGG